MGVNPQKRMPILVLALSGFFIVSSLILIVSSYREVRRVKSEIETIRSGIASLEAENNASREFQGLFEERKSDFDRINNFYIEKNAPLSFIERLESLGRRTGNVLTLDAENPTADPAFTFRATLEGAEKNVIRFLSALEYMPYEIHIESLNYTKSQSVGNTSSEQNSASGLRDRLFLTIRVKTQ